MLQKNCSYVKMSLTFPVWDSMTAIPSSYKCVVLSLTGQLLDVCSDRPLCPEVIRRPPEVDALSMPHDSIIARPGISKWKGKSNDKTLVHEEIIVPRGDSQIYPELLVRIMSMVRGYCFEVIYVASVSRMIRKKISSGALSHSSLVSSLSNKPCSSSLGFTASMQHSGQDNTRFSQQIH